MIAQAGRATGHSTLRKSNSSPPHHFTQLLYQFSNCNLLSPLTPYNPIPTQLLYLTWAEGVCRISVYILITCSPPLTFQPHPYDDIAKIKCMSLLNHNDYKNRVLSKQPKKPKKVSVCSLKKTVMIFNNKQLYCNILGLSQCSLSLHPSHWSTLKQQFLNNHWMDYHNTM